MLVEKIQGTENDDIAVLLLGYEALTRNYALCKFQEQMSSMLRNQNPGLARRFPMEMAFRFEDYTDQDPRSTSSISTQEDSVSSQELMQILRQNCQQKDLRVTIDFQEKASCRLVSAKWGREALRKLDLLRRSSSNFGNAGAVENLLKSAMSLGKVGHQMSHRQVECVNQRRSYTRNEGFECA